MSNPNVSRRRIISIKTRCIGFLERVIVAVGVPVVSCLRRIGGNEASDTGVIIPVTKQLQAAVAVGLVLPLAYEAEGRGRRAGAAVIFRPIMYQAFSPRVFHPFSPRLYQAAEDFCSNALLQDRVDLTRLPTQRRRNARQEIAHRGHPHTTAANTQ